MIDYKIGLFRAQRTFFQTLGGALAGLQLADLFSDQLSADVLVKLAAAVGSAALAAATAFLQNIRVVGAGADPEFAVEVGSETEVDETEV